MTDRQTETVKIGSRKMLFLPDQHTLTHGKLIQTDCEQTDRHTDRQSLMYIEELRS